MGTRDDLKLVALLFAADKLVADAGLFAADVVDLLVKLRHRSLLEGEGEKLLSICPRQKTGMDIGSLEQTDDRKGPMARVERAQVNKGFEERASRVGKRGQFAS